VAYADITLKEGRTGLKFSGDERCAGVSVGSKRGPSGDAAVMWAATPMLTAFVGSSCGPLVGCLQPRLEHL
jgi:hypothetical protein